VFIDGAPSTEALQGVPAPELPSYNLFQKKKNSPRTTPCWVQNLPSVALLNPHFSETKVAYPETKN